MTFTLDFPRIAEFFITIGIPALWAALLMWRKDQRDQQDAESKMSTVANSGITNALTVFRTLNDELEAQNLVLSKKNESLMLVNEALSEDNRRKATRIDELTGQVAELEKEFRKLAERK